MSVEQVSSYRARAVCATGVCQWEGRRLWPSPHRPCPWCGNGVWRVLPGRNRSTSRRDQRLVPWGEGQSLAESNIGCPEGASVAHQIPRGAERSQEIATDPDRSQLDGPSETRSD